MSAEVTTYERAMADAAPRDHKYDPNSKCDTPGCRRFIRVGWNHCFECLKRDGVLTADGSRAPITTANPKDAVGSSKAPMSTVSQAVLAELGVAMLEGALKYGRHNYRKAPIRASVYFDAVQRHMRSWFDAGEDIDPDSQLSHITKAIATLAVLRDSMITGQWDDDRPPPVPSDFFASCDKRAAELVAKYPEPKAAVRAKP